MRRQVVAVAIILGPVLVGCRGEDGRGGSQPTGSSLSVPEPAEEVTVTASITTVLGPHAVELGQERTLVLVVEGVPSSLRPGVEVEATGNVRIFRQELGAELGISLNEAVLERFEGSECLVVASLALPDRPLEVP